MKEVNGSIWHTMSTQRVTPTDFVCVIEISKGSKNKYERDTFLQLLLNKSCEISFQYVLIILLIK